MAPWDRVDIHVLEVYPAIALVVLHPGCACAVAGDSGSEVLSGVQVVMLS